MTERGELERAAALHEAGHLDEAARLYAQILAAEPRQAAALHMLAMLEEQRGRAVEAESLFARALEVEPRSAIAALRRGLLLRDLGRLGEAAGNLERALAINRDLAEAWNGLGLVLLDLRGPAAALPCYARALALVPSEPVVLVNHANVLRRLGRGEEGLGWLWRSLAARPDYAEAHYNRGRALHDLRCFDEAVIAYRRAAVLKPELIDAWSNVGSVLLGIGGLDDARAAYTRAAALSPSNFETGRSRLSTMLYREPADRRFHRLARAVAARAAPARPLPTLDNERDPDRRLRVGFLSSDFHVHPVARNIRALFEHRDRHAFDYRCYAHERRSDALTGWYRDHADGWRGVQDLSDQEAAEQIRRDRIDILVLLAGYFDRNRPMVAAWRAAPIQISLYDGATSGIPQMDYLIGDPILTPADGVEPFVETPVSLPVLYNHVPRPMVPIQRPQHRGDGGIIFGSFNNPNKLSPGILHLWGQVLARLPRARLLLKYKDDYARSWLQKKILAEIGAGAGVAGRISFVAADEQDERHLTRHGEIDIALDSHPFSGATTSFDALWMGVPVVTLLGETFLSRMTASHLIPLGLADLVAHSHEEYVNIAVNLAGDQRRLTALRATLRARLLASPLMDGPAYARNFEALLRRLWRRWATETFGSSRS